MALTQASSPLAGSEPHFTYADYCRWPEDERWELIDGAAYAMSSPSRLHQEVLIELGAQLVPYFRGKPCRPYIAPLDVRLPRQNEADSQVDTVVQPDLIVVCAAAKLDDKGCRGAPDWLIEVLSPSTALKDLNTKRDLYQRHQVREYWLVHPTERWIMVYLLDAVGRYGYPQVYGMTESTPVALFPELTIDWAFIQAV